MNEMTKINNLKNIDLYFDIMKKLTINQEELTYDEKTFILTCAILFIKEYEKDKTCISYIELAYYIILKYSLTYGDYVPLYDFSVNFGFFPIAQAITNDKLLSFDNIESSLISNFIDEKYSTDKGITHILEQKNSFNKIMATSNNEMSYVAPTSYGKSSLIVDHIRKNFTTGKKIAIIVPTKSLLMQTYKTIKKSNFNTKILIHDEMYNYENEFIAIFTQERALRLLDKNVNLYFDYLYIDEAHLIFERDSRSILLSRLIKLNRLRNKNMNIMYLSPLINDSDNLKFDDNQDIFEQRIRFNIKEPEFFEYCIDGKIQQYNRFLNTFFELGDCKNLFDYIHKYKCDKSFCYLHSPRKIEKFSKDLSDTILEENISDSISKIIKNLSKYVHEDFYIIDCLKKGIIYLHGKMPDNIKEYLEYKFLSVKEIKFLIANRVVLEGMNFPIDTLFILNANRLQEKDLTNLIGRVNRLNMVFGKKNNNLQKLIPHIHFVNSEEYNRKNSNLSNKIKLLKKTKFKDTIENPLLDNFDISKKKDEEKMKYETIIDNEKDYFSLPINKTQKLKIDMIALGMNDIYKLSDDVCNKLLLKIENFLNNPVDMSKHFLDRLKEVFIDGLEEYIVKADFKRLEKEKAVLYYKMYFDNKQKTIKERINFELDYYNKKKCMENSLLFVGESYGEVSYNGKGKIMFVDLKYKNIKQMVNIAIVKMKLEDDFVGYTLNKFFQLMLDYNLLILEEYNNIVYGTNNKKKLNLMKLGLSLNVINRLDEDNQLKNITIDEYGCLQTNIQFEKYKYTVDDFFRFELDKYF